MICLTGDIYDACYKKSKHLIISKTKINNDLVHIINNVKYLRPNHF